jgi:hypothetical protein
VYLIGKKAPVLWYYDIAAKSQQQVLCQAVDGMKERDTIASCMPFADAMLVILITPPASSSWRCYLVPAGPVVACAAS